MYLDTPLPETFAAIKLLLKLPGELLINIYVTIGAIEEFEKFENNMFLKCIKLDSSGRLYFILGLEETFHFQWIFFVCKIRFWKTAIYICAYLNSVQKLVRMLLNFP